MAAAASRRLATLAGATAIAVVGGLAASIAPAGAADPISNQSPPSLTAPANDTGTPVKDVVLTWTAVTYATSYQVQLSPNADFTNDLVGLPNNGMTINTTYQVPVSLPHDEYFWRVRAIDSGGHTAWSATRAFLHGWDSPMTLLKAPVATDPSLAWTPVPEASIYRVRYSTESDFPAIPSKTAVCWTHNTSFTPYTLQSSKENVTTNCMKGTDLADGLHLFYDVTAYDDSSAPVMTSDNVNDSSWDCPQPQPECDADSIFGQFDYSIPHAGTPSPGTVTGLATTWHAASLPGTNCTNGNCPTTPTFSWNAVTGANFYRVFIYRDPDATNIYRVFDTQWPSLTPREDLFDAQAGNGYYWRVLAGTCVNSDTDDTCGTPVVTGSSTGGGGGGGSTTPTLTAYQNSAVEMFDKSSGTVPLAAPANGAATNGSNVTFSWGSYFANGGQSSYDVRNYRLQVATDDEFDNVVWDFNDIDMTQFTNRSQKLPDGLYYWRVQPIDESGDGLAWSSVRQFTADTTPPVFSLKDKDGFPINGTFHVSVDDPQLVGTVNQSTLHVVPVVGGGAAVPGSWSSSGVTSWTFTPSVPLTTGQSYGLLVVGGLSDPAGNPAVASSKSVRVTTTADDQSSAWSFGSGWSRHSASNALHGTFERARHGHSATLDFVGSKVKVYGCKGPTLGKVSVSVDGVTQATVNEHKSFSQCGVLLWSGSTSSTAVHTLKVKVSSGTGTVDEAKIS